MHIHTYKLLIKQTNEPNTYNVPGVQISEVSPPLPPSPIQNHAVVKLSYSSGFHVNRGSTHSILIQATKSNTGCITSTE